MQPSLELDADRYVALHRAVYLLDPKVQKPDRAFAQHLLAADWLLPDRGYDADWFREGLIEKGTRPCIAGAKIIQDDHQI